jgi:hypothetical protein
MRKLLWISGAATLLAATASAGTISYNTYRLDAEL